MTHPTPHPHHFRRSSADSMEGVVNGYGLNTIELQQQLVLAHQGLLHTVAQRFTYMANYDDLVSAGQIGLIYAARGYKPEKGYQFSTFAVPHIRERMQRALAQEKTVKVEEKGLRAARRDPRTGNKLLPVAVSLEAAKRLSSDGGIGRAHARAMLVKLQARITKLPEAHRKAMVTRFFTNQYARHQTFRQVAAKLRLSVSTVYKLEQEARWKLGLAGCGSGNVCCHEEESGSCWLREMNGQIPPLPA